MENKTYEVTISKVIHEKKEIVERSPEWAKDTVLNEYLVKEWNGKDDDYIMAVHVVEKDHDPKDTRFRDARLFDSSKEYYTFRRELTNLSNLMFKLNDEMMDLSNLFNGTERVEGVPSESLNYQFRGTYKAFLELANLIHHYIEDIDDVADYHVFTK